MSERSFNYPNHPLFRITPLLDRGFGTVLHDGYASHLVGRIRAGRYMPELWDCNGFYLSRPAISAYGGAAIKSRHKMTPEQHEEYRRQWEADAPQREKRRAQRAAEQAEQARVSRETEERKARQAAERERREREWAEREVEVVAETEQWRKERASIMSGAWECSNCHRPATITAQPSGTYSLACQRCLRFVVADHATLVAMTNAQNIRLKPINSG